MNEDEKIILIPGWMNGAGSYTKNHPYNVLEIWKKRINEKRKVETDWMIGHSLGAHWALFNWEENKGDVKIILVNPLFPKRRIFIWHQKWMEFFKNDRHLKNKEIVKGIRSTFFGLWKCFEFLFFDFDEILEKIPKGNIFILHGENDSYYCDEKFREYISKKNITLLKVQEAGHDWHKNFDEEIMKIIKN